MTQDEIIKLVEDSGLTLHGDIEHFAELVAQHEREACAQFIETGYVRQFENPWRDDLSAAIRARGHS
jgi:hypothetical protein